MKIYVLIILLNINFAETIDRPKDPFRSSGSGKKGAGFFGQEQQTSGLNPQGPVVKITKHINYNSQNENCILYI